MSDLLNTCMRCGCRVIGRGDPFANMMEHLRDSHGWRPSPIAHLIEGIQPMTDVPSNSLFKITYRDSSDE